MLQTMPAWIISSRGQIHPPACGGSDAVASGEGPGTSPFPALSGRPSVLS
jgi:hypothetical protein